MDVLVAPSLAAAVDRIHRHLWSQLPVEMLDLGEGGRELIQRVVRRAYGLGVRSLAALCKFAILAVALGEHFDTDPRYPWASRLLNEESVTRMDRRVHRLAAAACVLVEDPAS